MLVFATKIPLKNTITKDECFQIFIEWIVGSPHYGIEKQEIKCSNITITTLGEYTFSKGDVTIRFRYYKDEDVEILACRLEKQDGNTVWDTDNIFLNKNGKKVLLVQLNRTSQEFSLNKTTPRKPYIVGMVVDNGLCDDDAGIPIDGKPLDSDEEFYDVCVNIMQGVHLCSMPAVYISSDYSGKNIVNGEELAKALKGLAHVFVERNHNTAYKLRNNTDENNVHNGYVGIYFPKTKDCLRYNLTHCNDAEKINKILSAVIEELLNRNATTIYNWFQIASLQSKQKIAKLKEISKEEFDEFVNSFDQENRFLREENEKLKQKLFNIQSELDCLKNSMNTNAGNGFYKNGAERELYLGETNDLLYSIFTQVKEKYVPGSRAYVILQSLINANPKIGNCKKTIDCLEKVIKPGTALNERGKTQLEDAGFEVLEDGSHYKLRFYRDGRYQFSVPKTPSDHRGGKNLFRDICKKIDIDRKIE